MLADERRPAAAAPRRAGARRPAGRRLQHHAARRRSPSTALTARCVYKPVRGERPLWDFPDGTLAGREVARVPGVPGDRLGPRAADRAARRPARPGHVPAVDRRAATTTEPLVGFVPARADPGRLARGRRRPRRRRRRVRPGPRRRPAAGPAGGARRGDQQRRPQGRPRAVAPRTAGCTASTTGSASTSRTSCAPCCGAGPASRCPAESVDVLEQAARRPATAPRARRWRSTSPPTRCGTVAARVDAAAARPPAFPQPPRGLAGRALAADLRL